MKIFLCGNYKDNTGPSNVNSLLINNSEKKLMKINFTNRYLKNIEIIIKILISDVIIFSGLGCKMIFHLKLAHLFKKKTIYLMHGCIEYENEVNELNYDKTMLDLEKRVFKEIDLILCVSEIYMKWVLNRYPNLKGKIHFLNSGVDISKYKTLTNCKNIDIYRNIDISVAGGDRKQKNNELICQSIQNIEKKIKRKVVMAIYGRKYYQNNTFEKYPSILFKGYISQNKFYSELLNSKIFILNSTVESFGLSAIDALMSGCSILISENSGVRSILKLEETDIIFANDDIDIISDKIIYLLNNPNNQRIIESIDINHNSWANVSERLLKISEALYEGKNYSKIK
ncbi:glycosyltransferase family 4 protein [Clostridium perfringens]|nr:glycosyltransferase family 4 protein [Clostridium perfringens]